jgi:phosphoglycolate phosphatase-like HAD superfamily hydrolase
MTKLHSIIFDWKRTLYNPYTSTLIDGAVDVLNYYSRHNIPMFLIGKGQQEMHDETNRLDVAKYFQDILFVEGSKDPNDFMKYMNLSYPERTIVIGDRVNSELSVGKRVGATTIWVKQGKFSNEIPKSDSEKPDYVVSCLSEILQLNLF